MEICHDWRVTLSFTCCKTEKYFILSVANIFKRNTKCIVEKYYSYQWGCGLGIGEIMIGYRTSVNNGVLDVDGVVSWNT